MCFVDVNDALKEGDGYDELIRHHDQFWSGGHMSNPWEEEDNLDDWVQGWTGPIREWS